MAGLNKRKQGFYSTGEFMKLAHVSKKLVRYYDEKNILKPAMVTEAGARFYTDAELSRLQQILLLKYLGFSLEDIRELLVPDADDHFKLQSLSLQEKLLEDRIEQLTLMKQMLADTKAAVTTGKTVDWSRMLQTISEAGLEKSLKKQYIDSSNITTRISLHEQFSMNKQGWFPFVFSLSGMRKNSKVLELGCGDGSFFCQNESKLPEGINVILTDISDGMLRDARRNVEEQIQNKALVSGFSYLVCDCQSIPFEAESFDLVIANHVLFYCEDVKKACREAARVLKPGGVFLCSTYGSRHMKEISDLVARFDDRIVLAKERLFERFGRENGADFLKNVFSEVTYQPYEDSLSITEAEPLISYIMSCHGNQNQYISEHYKEFRSFVKEECRYGFFVTKDAGVFVCKK